MKYLIISSLLFFLSCASENKPTNTSPENAVEVQAIATPTAPSWGDFWEKFQAATAQKDKAKIKELANFHDTFSAEDFDEYFEMYFSDEMLQFIATTKATDVKISEDGITDYEEERQITLLETSEEDGETYESALIFYFGKVGGKYALVQWMAAG